MGRRGHLLGIILGVAVGCCSADSSLILEEQQAFELGEGRFFNITPINLTSLTTFLNNTNILLYGGIIIGGIILFELALYFLDVYYNQTYLGGQSFNGKADGEVPIYYQDYPPYSDPFLATYRGKRDTDLHKVVSWIAMLEEAWGLAADTFRSSECQRKVVCELWRNRNTSPQMPAVQTLLKMSEYLSLPDDIQDVIDELLDIHNEVEERMEESCQTMFSNCFYSIDKIIDRYRSLD